MNAAPELLRVERSVALRNSTSLAVFALLLLGVVNVLWFNRFNCHTIMGDDVYAWAFYRSHPWFHDLFLSLLLAASITIRQEYRWPYAPFVVCQVYFCSGHARDKASDRNCECSRLRLVGGVANMQASVSGGSFVACVTDARARGPRGATYEFC